MLSLFINLQKFNFWQSFFQKTSLQVLRNFVSRAQRFAAGKTTAGASSQAHIGFMRGEHVSGAHRFDGGRNCASVVSGAHTFIYRGFLCLQARHLLRLQPSHLLCQQTRHLLCRRDQDICDIRALAKHPLFIALTPRSGRPCVASA